MKRINIEQNTSEWQEWRKGKITGSRLGDIIVKRGNGRKLGFYEVLAERLALIEPYEDPMERGHRLENVALKEYEEITGKKVKNEGVWVSDISDYIAISPDGEINSKEAVEVKCLSSAKHLQAFFEQKVPSEYEEQIIQYFIVNEKLKALHVIFYDPRIPSKTLHVITVNRVDIEEEIETYKEYQLEALADIEDKINQLTF